MCRRSTLALALLAGLLTAGAVLAAPLTPAQPLATQALPAWLADAAQAPTPAIGAPAPAPAAVLCSPPTNDFCPYANCICQRYTCARCGVKSFTCNEAQQTSTCVCKTC